MGERALAECARQAGLHMNADKKEAIVSAHRGVGAHRVLRLVRATMQKAQVTHLGRCPAAARYLGPHLHESQTFSAEKHRRLAGVAAAWAALGRFWTTAGVSKVIRLRTFQAAVVSVLLSGVEAFVLSSKYVSALESYMVGRQRALMRGKAHRVDVTEDGAVKHVAMSSIQCMHGQAC